jgi:hypothetical protein
MSKEVDFKRLREVFTLENADKRFRPDTPLEDGEVFKVYWTPELEPEEITIFHKLKTGKGYQFAITRIFQDALLWSYSWDKLDFDNIEEITLSDSELSGLCEFT